MTQQKLPGMRDARYPLKSIGELRGRLIGWLLHNANSSPPMIRRKEFYDLKTAILHKYGTPGQPEYQHFPQKDCFHCWSSRPCDDCDDYGHCCRCDGTGIYLPEVWIMLMPWTLGGFRFHSVGDKLYDQPEGEAAIIEGKITHALKPYHLPEECRLWLELFFAPRFFLKHYGCTMHFWRFSVKRPLVSLATVVGAFRFDRWRIVKAFLPHKLYFWLRHRPIKDTDEIPF